MGSRLVSVIPGEDVDLQYPRLSIRVDDRVHTRHAMQGESARGPKRLLVHLAASGLDDVTVRFLGDFRPGRPRVHGEPRPRRPGRADRARAAPRARLQRDSDALLLLIPDAGGRGRGILSGKVFEYLAAERPVLAVVPPTARPRSSCATPARRRRCARGRRRHPRRARRAARAVACGPARRNAALTGVARQAVARNARRGAGGPAEGARVTRCPSRLRARSRARAVTGGLLLATLFCVTFEKVHWNLGGDLGVADVLTVLLSASRTDEPWNRRPRTTAIVLASLRGVPASIYCA